MVPGASRKCAAATSFFISGTSTCGSNPPKEGAPRGLCGSLVRGGRSCRNCSPHTPAGFTFGGTSHASPACCTPRSLPQSVEGGSHGAADTHPSRSDPGRVFHDCGA